MKGIIDRFENDIVVIEIEGRTEDIQRSIVSPVAKPGDVVRLVDGIWEPDQEETTDRSQIIKEKLNSLWAD